jgi:hypothetical protein
VNGINNNLFYSLKITRVSKLRKMVWLRACEMWNASKILVLNPEVK